MVGITHAKMASSARPSQEGLALDHFLLALSGMDIGALLFAWRPVTLNKVANATAR